ncbi:GNAT family N-acetyltransferase [Chitinophaga sp. GbtcB8]|uniref:GNAT family N-acetyltransferase n=1 Tax=Chitinophaga sp. GbtcB8 TaxID=2824753 RepID=UPI001C30DE4B|nr:GNAT family N-acetyltransferase [Chitinophaga sp. GbtcB8]
MEIQVISPPITQTPSEKISALLHYCCLELNNSSCYGGMPKYDAPLAAFYKTTGYALHLRLDFSSIGLEVFVPLQYFSESGYHVFDLPAAEREIATGIIKVIDADGLAAIIERYAPALNAMHIDPLPDVPRGMPDPIAWFESYLQQNLPLLTAQAEEFILHQLMPVIGTLGYHYQADEIYLIQLAYRFFEAEGTDVIKQLLSNNKLGNTPNPLHKHFFSRALINPTGTGTVYSRYFPKENITVSIRPFDVDRDLEMVHEWFNREHAKKIWKMDWSLQQLETYYRTMLPGNAAHSYIGEINGEPTYNFEVYWVVRDMLADYYPALPTDYGTHQFIAPTDPRKKFASPSTQSMLDFVFAQPQVGKMVGEGSVESLAAIMNKAHVGFRIEKVIELPHKKANLNFCYREWYWAKFPEAQHITPQTEKQI